MNKINRNIQMEKKEIAKIIKKDITTLYNWEKRNPELYKAVYEYYNGIQLTEDEREILELFKKLNDAEKEYYKAEIKARILKKEIG
ncbi:TetR/AcrR family transcriptional regulator [Campylobacter concisus]|uniref:TetR/AcrR family transcriptional regulator n=1 Tax=Campylobacter concisus TaxID=199 RepID=UPI00215651DE|nr:TetR/AcrR family transcriptional regulator [Campylobacter concisus]